MDQQVFTAVDQIIGEMAVAAQAQRTLREMLRDEPRASATTIQTVGVKATTDS